MEMDKTGKKDMQGEIVMLCIQILYERGLVDLSVYRYLMKLYKVQGMKNAGIVQDVAR